MWVMFKLIHTSVSFVMSVLCVQVGKKTHAIAAIVVFATFMESRSWYRWGRTMVSRQAHMKQKAIPKPVALQVMHVAWQSEYVLVKDCWITHEEVPPRAIFVLVCFECRGHPHGVPFIVHTQATPSHPRHSLRSTASILSKAPARVRATTLLPSTVLRCMHESSFT